MLLQGSPIIATLGMKKRKKSLKNLLTSNYKHDIINTSKENKTFIKERWYYP
jgi:hypothetical protein